MPTQQKQKFELVKKYLPGNTLDLLRRIYTPIKYSHYSKGDYLIVQKVDKLLSRQFRNSCFNRYDLIIIYMAIEQYYNKNNIGYALYEKMQKKRMIYRQDMNFRDNKTGRFINEIIMSIEKNGFDYRSSITIDRNQHLCDGAHRFSSAIYFNIPVISVRVLRGKSDITYGIDWFKDHQFNTEAIEIMKRTKDDIFFRYGIEND